MNIRITIHRVAFFLLAVILLFGVVPAYAEEAARPKNIILFIGDGMGVSQITAGKIVKGNLNLEQFKILGLLTTHSLKTLGTDSAAAGTALATGSKTYNGSVSVSQNNEPLKTIVEYAKEKQKATGLVVSSSVTDATPAAFVAHVDSRRKEAIIAEQITRSGIDVLFGGGLAYFLPQSTGGSKRNDEMNLITELEKRMKVIRTVEEFQKLGDVDPVAGFFALRDMPKANERLPQLAEMTKKAIDILSKNQKGFFLMVEGSQIDWAAHKHSQDYLISEVIDFDNAVGIGLDFAKKDAQTLVIVTADHETGGFAIHDGSIKEKKITDSRFTGNRHTATMVPLFAYGPGGSAFAGIGDNTIVGKTIIQYLRESD
ncbi:MAG: alkaline phosphatase [Syntrophus sp. (in: bacteria)]|nr:alkaline phosphatase [Syntrophus sp. (in: bacteria)]